MNPRTINRQQARELDRRAVEEFGMTGLVLMENAGRGVVDTLCQLGIGGPVLVCCGRGNNGGDGFVIARHLDILGVATKTLLFADPATLTGDAAVAYAVQSKCGLVPETMTALDEGRLASLLASA